MSSETERPTFTKEELFAKKKRMLKREYNIHLMSQTERILEDKIFASSSKGVPTSERVKYFPRNDQGIHVMLFPLGCEEVYKTLIASGSISLRTLQEYRTKILDHHGIGSHAEELCIRKMRKHYKK
ncbi:MAG: hypothetical protein KBC98_00050 [Candidatus Pacebacteria bacterium]|jgi:hypothetical protein|nr:hypothetical protein [Candidatus Paceibacterota bacterium]